MSYFYILGGLKYEYEQCEGKKTEEIGAKIVTGASLALEWCADHPATVMGGILLMNIGMSLGGLVTQKNCQRTLQVMEDFDGDGEYDITVRDFGRKIIMEKKDDK